MRFLEATSSNVQGFWENQANSWTNPENHFLTLYNQIYSVILGEIEPFVGSRNTADNNTGKLLEVGAGGLSNLYFSEAVLKEAVALDISREALSKSPIWRRIVCDIREGLPIQPERFDTVSSFFLMRYVKKPHQLVNEMMRVLKPGGRVLIVDYNSAYLFPGLEQEFDPYLLREKSALGNNGDLEIRLIDGDPSTTTNPYQHHLLYLITATKPKT